MWSGKLGGSQSHTYLHFLIAYILSCYLRIDYLA